MGTPQFGKAFEKIYIISMFKLQVLGEDFSLDIRSPPHHQVIFKVSHVFKSLLNPNILHLKPLIFTGTHQNWSFSESLPKGTALRRKQTWRRQRHRQRGNGYKVCTRTSYFL